MRRHFGRVAFASHGGGFVVERYDGVGMCFLSAQEAALAGELVVGDRIEMSIRPGAVAVSVLLDRRARHLAAVTPHEAAAE